MLWISKLNGVYSHFIRQSLKICPVVLSYVLLVMAIALWLRVWVIHFQKINTNYRPRHPSREAVYQMIPFLSFWFVFYFSSICGREENSRQNINPPPRVCRKNSVGLRERQVGFVFFLHRKSSPDWEEYKHKALWDQLKTSSEFLLGIVRKPFKSHS